jgi:hypothetical protein
MRDCAGACVLAAAVTLRWIDVGCRKSSEGESPPKLR